MTWNTVKQTSYRQSKGQVVVEISDDPRLIGMNQRERERYLGCVRGNINDFDIPWVEQGWQPLLGCNIRRLVSRVSGPIEVGLHCGTKPDWRGLNVMGVSVL